MIGRLFGALFEDFRDPWGNKRRAEEAERNRREEEAERVRKEKEAKRLQATREWNELYTNCVTAMNRHKEECRRRKVLKEGREKLKARLNVGRVR